MVCIKAGLERGGSLGKLKVQTDDIRKYLNRMYAYYEEQEDVIKNHVSIIQDIQDHLAIEDLAAVQFELEEVERRGKVYVDQKMSPLHDILPQTQPIDPYIDAVSTVQQYIQENDLMGINRAIRELQPYNRTTEPKEPMNWEGVAEFGLDIVGVNDLYRAFNGKDPFTGESLSFAAWLESVGWSILTVVPPARLAKGAGKVGTTAKDTHALQTTKVMNAQEKLTQLSQLAKAHGHTIIKKGKELTHAEADRLVRQINEMLDNLGFFPNPAFASAGGPSFKVVENQFQMFSKGKTGAGKSLDNSEVIYNANRNPDLRKLRRPAFDKILDEGFENGMKLNPHAYNSLFKSGRKAIMPDDVIEALRNTPKKAQGNSLEYINPKTGTSVFVNADTNEVVGIWPATFKR